MNNKKNFSKILVKNKKIYKKYIKRNQIMIKSKLNKKLLIKSSQTFIDTLKRLSNDSIMLEEELHTLCEENLKNKRIQYLLRNYLKLKKWNSL